MVAVVGRVWAIIFAPGGVRVPLHDSEPAALDTPGAAIEAARDDLRRVGLIDDAANSMASIRSEAVPAAAIEGVAYAQRCGPDRLERKREVFAALDAVAAPDAILASSSSGLGASAFAAGLRNPERYLFPTANPPSVVTLLELCPAPATAGRAAAAAHAQMERVRQAPVRLRRETADDHRRGDRGAVQYLLLVTPPR